MSIKISIIGAAGTLGSYTAYRLAGEGLADELVMIDVNRNMLLSHIMDLQIAVTGLQNVDIRAGNAEDLTGSDIVIHNAGAPWRVVSSRIEKLQENLPIIEAQLTPDEKSALEQSAANLQGITAQMRTYIHK